MSPANLVDNRTRECHARNLQFNDDRRTAIAREHLAKGGHTNIGQLSGRTADKRPTGARRAIEQPIVMDDDRGVAGEMDVELETVGTRRKPAIERSNSVFRSNLAAAAVRKNERARRVAKRLHGRILG